MPVIHCGHCGADNEVKPDVIGTLCKTCGTDIYRPDFEKEMSNEPPTPVAVADRTGNVLRVTCPHCQFVNEFPGFDMMYVFLCHECGKPVEVSEPVQ